MRSMVWTGPWALCLAVSCAVACGHTRGRAGAQQQLRRAQGAVAAAEAARAAAAPLPALHLQLAQEALAQADQLRATNACARAEEALGRAEADAKLALALVQETAACARAEELHDRLTDLVEHLHVSGLALDGLSETYDAIEEEP